MLTYHTKSGPTKSKQQTLESDTPLERFNTRTANNAVSTRTAVGFVVIALKYESLAKIERQREIR